MRLRLVIGMALLLVGGFMYLTGAAPTSADQRFGLGGLVALVGFGLTLWAGLDWARQDRQDR
jgi:hypothetical protein